MLDIINRQNTDKVKWNSSIEYRTSHNKPWEYNQVEKEVASAGTVIGGIRSKFDPLPKISNHIRN